MSRALQRQGARHFALPLMRALGARISLEVAMSVSRELSEVPSRFKAYVERLVALFKQHEIDSLRSLVQAIRGNEAFSSEWKRTWLEIADVDGGKLSLSSAGLVLGNALGGVGIAALGGAIGLPLAVVLGLGGLLVGAEIDVVRRSSGSKWTLISLPKDVHARVAEAAETAGCSINDVIVQVLTVAFLDPKTTGE